MWVQQWAGRFLLQCLGDLVGRCAGVHTLVSFYLQRCICCAARPPRMTMGYLMVLLLLAGPLLLQQLPPEVAARQAGRTTASAPSPDNWLLQLLPPAGQTWGDYEPGAVLLALEQSKRQAVFGDSGTGNVRSGVVW